MNAEVSLTLDYSSNFGLALRAYLAELWISDSHLSDSEESTTQYVGRVRKSYCVFRAFYEAIVYKLSESPIESLMSEPEIIREVLDGAIKSNGP